MMVESPRLMLNGSARSLVLLLAGIWGFSAMGRVEGVEGEFPTQPDWWEIWGTAYTTGHNLQDKLLAEGHLRDALRTQKLEAAQILIQHQLRPDINSADEDGRTALHMIAREGVAERYRNGTKLPIPDHLEFAPQYEDGGPYYNDGFLEVFHLWYEALHTSNPEYPEWNKKPRDNSGQTPLHEAALYGNILTAKWLVLHDGHTGDSNSASDVETAEGSGVYQVRATPLEKEWAIGWTMMNFAAMGALDQNTREPFYTGGSATVVSNSEVFQTTTGLSVMDYAVANNQLKFVQWLLTYKDISDSGLANLHKSTSNWKELPIHKAVTLGYIDIVELLIDQGEGCPQVLETSEGGETVVHIAAAAGWDNILSYFQSRCPAQFASALGLQTSLNTDPAVIKYFWGGETPCIISESVITNINLIHGVPPTAGATEAGGVCDNGECHGNFRSYCSHDNTMFCYRDKEVAAAPMLESLHHNLLAFSSSATPTSLLLVLLSLP